MTQEEMKQKEPFFGKWRIVEKIGSGSYGDVYKIKCSDYNGTEYYSALKVISIPKDEEERAEIEKSCGTPENIKGYYEEKLNSLQNEIDLMSQFKGKTNIVSYEDHEIVPKTENPLDGFDVFMRMELLEDLKFIQISRPALLNNQIEIIRIGKDICTALEVCHAHYIIHRDIKMGNIMRSKDGDYKLGDFGVARSLENVQSATRVGTLSYMAPEVQQGKVYDIRADIYSLGMVLYGLLNANRGPFLPLGNQEPTVADKERARKRCLSGEQIPLPYKADPRLGMVVRKACAYNPDERYATAKEFREALEMAEKQMLGRVPKTPTQAAVVKPKPDRPEEQATSTQAQEKEVGHKSHVGILIFLIILFIGILSVLGVAIYGVQNGWFDTPVSEEEEEDIKDVGDEKTIDDVDDQEEDDSKTVEEPEEDEKDVFASDQSRKEDELEWGGKRVLGSNVEDETHRYIIIQDDVTWKEAFEASQQYPNGYLAHIDSMEEFNAIIDLLNEEGYGKDSESTYFIWLGGRRYDMETDYYWVDVEGNRVGTSLNSESFWLDGEPSLESAGEQEQYMNMYYSNDDGFRWNDVPNDLVELSSYYSGRIVYIVEIED